MSDHEPLAARRPRWKTTLRALRNRNFRLFFIGQGISQCGTWMQMVALGWLVTRLTGSAAWLGTVGFANRVPSAIVTPLAGVVVDRYNRHRIVIVSQVLAMVQALVLGALTLSGHIQLWHILVLGVGLGLVSAVEVPARQSFFVELVDGKEDLANAIALNSSLFHGARLIGPSVAGLLIAAFPTEGPCFIINGISYLAVIAGLLMMTLPPREKVVSRPVLKDLRAGLKYVAGLPPIRDLLLLLALVSLVGMPYPVLLPIYAKDVLNAGPKVLGYLYTAGGAGALTAALWLANRTQLEGLGRIVPRATMVFGFAAILMGTVHWVPAALLLMPFVAGGLMTRGAASNTVVQTVTDDGMRGRVVSLYAVAVMGVQPFGSLLMGFVGEHLGVPNAFRIGGFLAVVAAALFTLRLPALSKRITEQGDETKIYGAVTRGVEVTSEAMPAFRQ